MRANFNLHPCCADCGQIGLDFSLNYLTDGNKYPTDRQ